MALLFAVSVFFSLFTDQEGRRVSSVPDINPNITIDLIREDEVITRIYHEKVNVSTKEKGEILMKHTEIYVGYLSLIHI